MATRTWKGGATAVAQVNTYNITLAALNTEVWTLTATGEDGTTTTVTYTQDATPTITEAVVGLVAAWNSSVHPLCTGITAAGSATPFTLTADTAGTPFSVSLTVSGSTGTSTTTFTTLNSGPYDYGTAANWVEGAVPVAADDVVLNGSVKILYGLRQSSVSIGNFTAINYTGTVGSAGLYLSITPTSFLWAGTGQAYFNINAANISPRIMATATTAAPSSGMYLKGSNIATLRVDGGSVGLAAFLGETSTVATVQVMGSGRYFGGTGVTQTTFHQCAGTAEINSAATTLNLLGGTTTVNGSGAYTTVNEGNEAGGATVYWNGTGTITTWNNKGGSLDLTKTRLARTVSTFNYYGGIVVYDTTTTTFTAFVVQRSGKLQLQ